MATDADYMKDALKTLADKFTVEKAIAFVEAKKALDAIAEGEDPTAEEEPPAEDPAAMGDKPDAETVKASATPAKAEPAKEPEAHQEPVKVEADAVPADVGQPVDLAGDPAEAEMAHAALSLVAEAAQMDLPALIAAMQEDPGKFAAAAGGESAPPEAEAALSDDVKAVAASRIGAVQKQLTDEKSKAAKLAARVEELEVQERTRRVDAAIAAGHLLDKDRDRAVSLAKRAPDVLEDWLKDAEKEPEVPTGKPVKASRHNAGLNEITATDPRVQKYVRAGLSLSLAQRRVANPDEPYAEALKAVQSASTGAA